MVIGYGAQDTNIENSYELEMHVKDNDSDAYFGKILILVYSPNPTTNSKTTNPKKDCENSGFVVSDFGVTGNAHLRQCQ